MRGIKDTKPTVQIKLKSIRTCFAQQHRLNLEKKFSLMVKQKTTTAELRGETFYPCKATSLGGL